MRVCASVCARACLDIQAFTYQLTNVFLWVFFPVLTGLSVVSEGSLPTLTKGISLLTKAISLFL